MKHGLRICLLRAPPLGRVNGIVNTVVKRAVVLKRGPAHEFMRGFDKSAFRVTGTFCFPAPERGSANGMSEFKKEKEKGAVIAPSA